MVSRLSRYEDNNNKNNVKPTRLGKNQYLYDDINDKIGYEEIINLDTQTRIDLSDLTGEKINREDYQKVKEYQNIISFSQEKEIEKPIEEKKEKIYDINDILNKARENRSNIDELEKKRKLKETEYNNLKELTKKHLEKKESKKDDINEEELTDLINTITSHNLAKELEDADKEIFEDLMATNIDINLEDGIAEEAIEEEKKKKIVNSFYTKSMDLSNQDFEISDEIEAENRVRTRRLIIVTVIILLIGIGIGVFLFLKKHGIL